MTVSATARAEAKAIEPKVVYTFASVAEDYITQFSPSWSNAKHAGQWRATIETYVNPVIGRHRLATSTLPPSSRCSPRFG